MNICYHIEPFNLTVGGPTQLLQHFYFILFICPVFGTVAYNLHAAKSNHSIEVDVLIIEYRLFKVAYIDRLLTVQYSSDIRLNFIVTFYK